jgi:hypothetical protein
MQVVTIRTVILPNCLLLAIVASATWELSALTGSRAALDSARTGTDSERPAAAAAFSKPLTVVMDRSNYFSLITVKIFALPFLARFTLHSDPNP